MELQSELTINGKKYAKGDQVPWYAIYPFFLVHMGMFGLSGFFMAYADKSPNVFFLFLHGGFACLIYLLFYTAIFGVDKVRWMFINAGLGLFGIYAQIDWILGLFGKRADDYSTIVHVIPFFYYILYTFLLYQMVLDVTKARSNPGRRQLVDAAYIVGSIVVYGSIWLSGRKVMRLPCRPSATLATARLARARGAAVARSKVSSLTPKAAAMACSQRVVPSSPKGKGASMRWAPARSRAAAVSPRKGCSRA
jgi:hypothetical protein